MRPQPKKAADRDDGIEQLLLRNDEVVELTDVIAGLVQDLVALEIAEAVALRHCHDIDHYRSLPQHRMWRRGNQQRSGRRSDGEMDGRPPGWKGRGGGRRSDQQVFGGW